MSIYSHIKITMTCYTHMRIYSYIFKHIKIKIFLIVTALPNITVQPVSKSIREGELNVTAMSCKAIGISPLYYQWERYQVTNNSWTKPSPRAVNTTSPNLEFSSITKEDEGVYHCIITNDDGSVISDNATILVYGKGPVSL